jgi:hypothetical protein
VLQLPVAAQHLAGVGAAVIHFTSTTIAPMVFTDQFGTREIGNFKVAMLCTPALQGTPCIDGDGDGFGLNCPAGADRDDNDEDVNPNASEPCNGIDDDCDGTSTDGIEDPQVGTACDGVGDADVCATGTRSCASGVLQCSDDGNSDLVDVIIDGGFQQGPGAGAWTEFSTNFGTPICSVASCGAASSPRTGTYFVFLGGIDAEETGYVTQLASIPPGTATLSYWFSAPSCDDVGADTFSVHVDGAVVQSSTNFTTLECDAVGYVQRSVDLGAYADGASHTVEFRGVFTSSGLGVTSFFVDDVRLEVCP